MHHRTYIAPIVFALALISGGPAAQAQNDLAKKAKVHFNAGEAYYDEADYEQALREYQRAYDLNKSPKVQYNLSLTYEKLGDLNNAIAALEKYLNEEKKISNRATLEIRLQNMRKRLEQQRQDEIAAQEQAAAEAVEAAPAEATAQDTAASAQTPAKNAAKAPGADKTAQKSETKQATAGTTASASNQPAKSKFPTPVLVSFIAAGVGASTFALFGIMAAVENGRLKDKCLPGPTCTKDEVSNLRTYSLVADIGLGIALVGGVVGTVLLLTSGEKETKPVAVAPWIAPAAFGAVSQVRF